MSQELSLGPLAELNRRLAVFRDRVRGVALGHHNGFYVFGRPGTSKTYTARTVLDSLGVKYAYHSGHITDLGLFELLEEHHDRVVLLDDVSSIFKQRVALQILLAALGNQPSERGHRIVKYRRQGREDTIRFTGGIIAISNLELHSDSVLAALKSRVNYMKYDPTDEEMRAMLFDVAGKGWQVKNDEITPQECLEIVEFLIAQSQRLGVRLDMRNLVDKAYPDYLQHRKGNSETHWKDLICTTLEEQFVSLQHTPATDSRQNTKRQEQMIAKLLVSQHPDRESQLKRWIELTGKSERAFYRRLKEIEMTA